MQRWLLASWLALPCPLACAAENGFYFGAGLNSSEIDDAARGLLGTLDLDDTAGKVIAGLRPFDFLAAELTYMDLGSESASLGASAEATALSASVIGLFALPLVDLYGKAGIARWELDSFAGDPCLNPSGPCPFVVVTPRHDAGTDVLVGAGVQAKLKRLAIRLEYERFDIDDTDGAEIYTLGFTWTF